MEPLMSPHLPKVVFTALISLGWCSQYAPFQDGVCSTHHFSVVFIVTTISVWCSQYLPFQCSVHSTSHFIIVFTVATISGRCSQNSPLQRVVFTSLWHHSTHHFRVVFTSLWCWQNSPFQGGVHGGQGFSNVHSTVIFQSVVAEVQRLYGRVLLQHLGQFFGAVTRYAVTAVGRMGDYLLLDKMVHHRMYPQVNMHMQHSTTHTRTHTHHFHNIHTNWGQGRWGYGCAWGFLPVGTHQNPSCHISVGESHPMTC